MRLTINANGFLLTEALRAYTEQRIAIALGWASQHMRKLAVSLSDINGPRGGVDKRCCIHVQLGTGREVIIEDTEDDLYVAINRAAERADRAVLRQIQRNRDFSHSRLAPTAVEPVNAGPEQEADSADEQPVHVAPGSGGVQ